jgi:MFS family permease
MWTLFAGRALQGFGSGAMFATIYAIVSGAYDDRLRPAMLAALSSAWIVPSLIGPVISGVVADNVSWRYVFWGLLPIIGIITPLTWPTYRSVTLEQDPTAQANARRVPYAIVLAIGTGLFLAGPDLRPAWLAGLVTAAGLAALFGTLGRLLPRGTFTARPLLGAAIANRALVFGAFAVTETYMVYALKEVGGVSTAMTGVVITVGSLTWTAGAILQARMDRAQGAAGRAARVRAGTALMILGAGGIAGMVMLFGEIWVIPTALAWLVTGLGIGLAYTTSTAVAFAAAPRGQDGMVASSTLLGDLFASAVGVGIGGILLSAGGLTGFGTAGSTALALAFGLVLLALATLAAIRLGGEVAATSTAQESPRPQTG